MLVKVGQVRGAREAQVLRGADIFTAEPGDVELIREATSASICLPAGDLDEAATVVAAHRPDFVEFLAVDPEKTDLVTRQLAALRNLGVPTIARGFSVSPDDTSLLDRQDHLRALEDAGVRYFEVEIDSLVDPESSIPDRVRARLGDLFSRFDVLVTDAFTDLSLPLGLNEHGVYLDLGNDRGRPQSFKPSAAARLIRSRAVRR